MRKYDFKPEQYKKEFLGISKELVASKKLTSKSIDRILKNHPMDGSKIFSRDKLIKGLEFVWQKQKLDDAVKNRILESIKLKPTRSISGVSTVTVLTKPFACPGKCLFCPNDVRMPKSYIATEPGAQRALMNRFSPFLQVWNRLTALKNIGHPTDKIELLILGGTWSYYPESYRVWFVSECFRALNEFDANKNPEFKGRSVSLKKHLEVDFNDELRKKLGNKPYNQLIQTSEFNTHFAKYISDESNKELRALWNNLEKQHRYNSKANCRCVGLVLETRPDAITNEEVLKLRKLGATKIQLGIQVLNDKISDLNKRGEHKKHTAEAFKLLRAGGFKIHAHMMTNLYKATPKTDLKSYKDLFTLKDYKPDEVKIYPTSVIKNTELEKLFSEGKYKPYTTQELIELVAKLMETTPQYCRITRVIRDIPSTEIFAGNKSTNLREVVEWKLKKQGKKNENIRAREIKNELVSMKDLKLDIVEYKTTGSTELFLQYVTTQNKIAGFLRLSLPESKKSLITNQLDGCAIVREVHVYGPSLELDKISSGQAQHLGLGTKLIQKAKELALENGFKKLAVISSIGTREYYNKRGFKLTGYYQVADIQL